MHTHHHYPQDISRYSHEVKKTLWVVLFFNWLVAVLKLIFGYMIGSVSLLADGYHSFADGSSNIIGMRVAGRPKDKDHPYGHKKYETFTSIFIGFLLVVICFHILHSSLQRFQSARPPQINFLSFAVVGLTMVINIVVMLYERTKGQRIGSDILISDALHTRADIFTSLSVFVSFIGVKLGFPILDPVIALLIVVFIGFSAFEIFRHSSSVLCDTAVLEDHQVEKLVLGVKGVKRCHQVRTRGRHDDVHIDLHVLVDDAMSIKEAHDLSSEIEHRIRAQFGGVTDVMIHVEPLSSEEGHHEA